jgi:hypothetical protein
MTRTLVDFIRRVVRSHLAHVLLAISWSFILLVYVRPHLTQPQFVTCIPADDEFVATVDAFYPIWIGAIAVAHFPSIFLTQALTKLLQKVFSLSCGPTAKVEMPLFFVSSAIQWLLVGYIIESFFHRWRSDSYTHPTH